MPKITPHLWFDKEAREAAAFYTSLFKGTIKHTNVLDNTPSGSVDILTIDLAGMEFSLISAGPLFKFTPAISFLVACETKDEVDALWSELSRGGTAMMELGEYPFSERYGWIQDRFGLSWQLMYAGGEPIRQKITPVLMFTGEQAGKAETAIDFYTSVFHGSKKGDVWRYEAGEEPEQPGTVKWSSFTLDGVDFGAMDSARVHGFGFNEAVSIMVHCDTQEQIDYYWEKLSAVPAAEQCGWLKDKFGVSWQIVPAGMDEMLAGGDKARIARVTEAFLQMKKFDIAKLQAAADGA
jgi:predicted 3-demethylubiquinone-9 3-methyltransferase (glyoxalase superfamily)